jgi:hypothetical protein
MVNLPNTSVRWKATACAIALATAVAGCERAEPRPEPEVKFQATGKLFRGTGVIREAENAALVIRQDLAGFSLELRGAESGELLASGRMFAGALETKDLRGPMETSFTDTDRDGINDRLAIRQAITAQAPVFGIQGPRSAGATHAVLERSGTRWMSFSAGVIETGTQGRVTLRLGAGDPAMASTFEGVTTTDPVRNNDATRARGRVEAPWGMGGDRASQLAIAIPQGSGAMLSGGWRQLFSFDPRRDVLDPRGEVRIVHADPDYVEITDDFTSGLKVNRVDLGRGRVATATGRIEYGITLAVTREQILLTGRNRLQATITEEGRGSAEFSGSTARIDTLLEW